MAMPVILGLPAIAWGGLLTGILMLYTAYLGWAVEAQHKKLLKRHMLFAKLTVVMGLIHGIAGLLWALGYI